MNAFRKGIGLIVFIMATQPGWAELIPAPNTQNIFYNEPVAPSTGVGLWVAPLNLAPHSGESNPQGAESIPQGVSNVLNSASPSQLLNNLFNNGLLNQVGVGVKVNF